MIAAKLMTSELSGFYDFRLRKGGKHEVSIFRKEYQIPNLDSFTARQRMGSQPRLAEEESDARVPCSQSLLAALIFFILSGDGQRGRKSRRTHHC